jgi:hypothetical protein
MKLPTQVSVEAAAAVCGFACYLPVAGLRGALFCLFPGIVLRSLRIAFQGAGLGFLADIAVVTIWSALAGVWEPRVGFNRTLVSLLPPDFTVMTGYGSPMPNSLKFGLGLIFWTVTMYALWMTIWIPKLPWLSCLAILAVGAMAVGICATILWIVTPLDEWWGYRGKQLGLLSPVPWFAVFILTMPTCAVIVGCLMRLSSRKAGS